MATINVTEENLEATLKVNDITILDFWAEWCRPCKMFGPVFEEVSNKNTDITFGKINTEEQINLAQAFQIGSIPMVMVFREGVIVYSEPGALPEAALVDLIDKVRALDMDEVRAEVEGQTGCSGEEKCENCNCE